MFWSCDFQRGPSRGCWRGVFSSHKFCTRTLVRLESSLYYLVLQGASQHLVYLLLINSQTCQTMSHLRYPLRPWGSFFSFWCFRRFRRRLQSGQRMFFVVPTWTCLSPIRHTLWSPLFLMGLIILGIPALLLYLGLLPSDHSFGCASCVRLIPRFFLILGVFRSSWQEWFAIASDIPGSFLPPSVFIFLIQRRFFRTLPFYPTKFLA